MFVQRFQHAADVAVDVFAHRHDAGVAFVESARAIFLEQVLRGLKRHVRSVECDIAEKRSGTRSGDEIDGGAGQGVGDVSRRIRRLAIALGLRIEIVAPVPERQSVEFVESLGVGMVRPLRAVVPFSETARGVSRAAQHLGDGDFVRAHDFLAPGDPVHSGPQGVASGQQARARRRTDRIHEKAFEARAFAGQAVEPRRVDARIAMRAHIAPALVVCQDQQNIRLAAIARSRRRQTAGASERGA
ncbi:MAG: hypothetical protein BWZ10_01495 [candidate division BRC1 bacterium ADurb.BinA364]|nr:MAG: hypothetical protein BWZ10_01495 [candidate division BRC1 bacterium ADurb.BinA364]